MRKRKRWRRKKKRKRKEEEAAGCPAQGWVGQVRWDTDARG